MKYKFSHTETGRGAEAKSVCSVCGKLHKGNYGFSCEAESRGRSIRVSRKLCTQCSSKIMPQLIDYLWKLDGECQKLREVVGYEEHPEIWERFERIADALFGEEAEDE